MVHFADGHRYEMHASQRVPAAERTRSLRIEDIATNHQGRKQEFLHGLHGAEDLERYSLSVAKPPAPGRTACTPEPRSGANAVVAAKRALASDVEAFKY